MFYIIDLPSASLFDVKSTGIYAGFVLALVGWIFFSVFAGAYILGC
jgi:hypothetical protein